MFKGRTWCDPGGGVLLEGNGVRNTPGCCGGNRFNWCSKLCFPPVVYKMPNCARSHAIICNYKPQDFNSGLRWRSLTCSYIAVCSLGGFLNFSHIKNAEIHVTAIKWGLNQTEMACPKSHTSVLEIFWMHECVKCIYAENVQKNSAHIHLECGHFTPSANGLLAT